jgi:hypothetical protein
MIFFWSIIWPFNHSIKFPTDEHIPYLKYLTFPPLIFLLILLCSLLSIDNRSVPSIEFNLMHYLTNQSLLMLPSREITPADCSLHRPKLVIDWVLVIYDARAVRKGHYVAALVISDNFTDETIFEDQTRPEAASGTG